MPFWKYHSGAMRREISDLSKLRLGWAVASPAITDDQEAIFTPFRYPLCSVRTLQGPQLSRLNEISSFHGRFCEQAGAGESVMASDTMERIEDNQGDIRHRLLLGNSSQDTFVIRQQPDHLQIILLLCHFVMCEKLL